MRGPRIKDEGEAYYHMISRVVDRRMLFDTHENRPMKGVSLGSDHSNPLYSSMLTASNPLF